MDLQKHLNRLMVVAAVIIFFGSVGTSVVFAIDIKLANPDTPFDLTLTKSNGEYGSTDIKCKAFKKIIEESSHGRIKVKIFPDCQLGGEREMWEMTKLGSLEMNGCSGAVMANFLPEVMAIQIPYIFKDENVALQVMNGPVGKELGDIFVRKVGIRILAWGTEGYYNFQSVKKPIRVPEDMKGLKMRTVETPNLVEVVRLSGGVATPIPFPELYTSLQQGVVDGLNTAIGVTYTCKVYELIKHFNFADPWPAWSPIAINEKFYQSLSPDDQYLVKEAAVKAMATFQGMIFWGRDQWIEMFKERGINVYFPTPAEKEKWITTLKDPMIKWTKDKIGSQLVDKVIKASEGAEKELYGRKK